MEDSVARSGRLSEQLNVLRRQLKREAADKESLANKLNELLASQQTLDKKPGLIQEAGSGKPEALQKALDDEVAERKRLESLNSELRRKLKAAASHRGGASPRDSTPEDGEQLRYLEGKLEQKQTQLESERQKLSEALRKLQQYERDPARDQSLRSVGEDSHSEGHRRALEECERLRRECTTLLKEAEMHSRQADELRRENSELKGELSAFDPAFWDEIEDLKLNYREAMDAKRRYEQMLSQSVSHSCDCKPTWLARLQIGWATRVLQLCVAVAPASSNSDGLPHLLQPHSAACLSDTAFRLNRFPRHSPLEISSLY